MIPVLIWDMAGSCHDVRSATVSVPLRGLRGLQAAWGLDVTQVGGPGAGGMEYGWGGAPRTPLRSVGEGMGCASKQIDFGKRFLIQTCHRGV